MSSKVKGLPSAASESDNESGDDGTIEHNGWAVVLPPGEEVKSALFDGMELRVTQACLASFEGKTRTTVSIVVGGKPMNLASLTPGLQESCGLDLMLLPNFEEGEAEMGSVTFVANGANTVHLTGFFITAGPGGGGPGDYDSDGPFGSEAEEDDDEDDDSFGERFDEDDDVELAPPGKITELNDGPSQPKKRKDGGGGGAQPGGAQAGGKKPKLDTSGKPLLTGAVPQKKDQSPKQQGQGQGKTPKPGGAGGKPDGGQTPKLGGGKPDGGQTPKTGGSQGPKPGQTPKPGAPGQTPKPNKGGDGGGGGGSPGAGGGGAGGGKTPKPNKGGSPQGGKTPKPTPGKGKN
jgi:hypothetical protein